MVDAWPVVVLGRLRSRVSRGGGDPSNMELHIIPQYRQTPAILERDGDAAANAV